MIMDLDRDSTKPLYLQISTHLADLISRGQLGPGARLPSTRDLAVSLGVNRTTVVAAYGELEARGLVSSHVGRGTAVSAHLPAGPSPAVGPTERPLPLEALLSATWRNSYPHMPAGAEQLLGSGEPALIDFASNEPDSTLFPVDDFAACVQSALRTWGADLLGSGGPEGFPPLLDFLPAWLARRGIRCTDREVMVVNGVQQGLSIAGRLLVDPGDTVILENLTYPGALGVFRSFQATCIGVPVDGEGIDIDLLESVLDRRKAKLLYTMPTYHNPTGVVLSPERRERLLAACRRHQLVVIEDDYVHELVFDDREILPLKARDAVDGVISMGSFTEIAFPGIRLSWVVAPASIIERMSLVKRLSYQSTNRLLQGALLEFIRRGMLDRLIKRKQTAYRRRRDTLADAMRRFFPEEVRWVTPRGGIFQWVDLPRGMDALALLLATREKGVVFAPDRIFSVEEWERAGLRLGFAGLDEDRINDGIRVIGDAMKTAVARSAAGKGRTG